MNVFHDIHTFHVPQLEPLVGDVEAEVAAVEGLMAGCATEWCLCRRRSCFARVSCLTDGLADSVQLLF